MDFEEARKAIVAQFAAVPVAEQPFPHFYTREAFPPAFFQEIRANLPPEELLTPTDARRSSNPYGSHRRKFGINAQNVEMLDPARRRFWSRLQSLLCGREFLELVLSRFGAGIARRYGGRPLDPVGRLEINVDGENYAIAPHTDSEAKIATMLFYLPEDESRADLGTAIFAPKQAGFVSERPNQYPFELFDKVKAFPYVPNSCFTFLKTDNSFHGRETVTGENLRRPMMFVSIQHSRQSLEGRAAAAAM
ncbi:MAG: hypothetical protein AB7O45_11030 [Alphaproteobacteria bacterium]